MPLVRYADVPWRELLRRQPTGRRNLVRFWDLAATKPSKDNPDPDWTAGALLGLAHGEWYLLDVRRTRNSPAKVEDFLWHTHELDDEWVTDAAEEHGVEVPDGGLEVRIVAEQEGGSSGKHTIDLLGRTRFVGCDFTGKRPKGSKYDRAVPVSTAAERGHLWLLEGPWNEQFVLEAEVFPDGTHDDQVDAVSGGFQELKPKRPPKSTDPDLSGVNAALAKGVAGQV